MTISDIDSGEDHTCALAGGVLYCWGSNSEGQLGIGEFDNAPVPTAVEASGDFQNSSVTAFATGENHTCAVEGDVAYCWGRNRYDQVGDNSGEDYVLLPSKVADVQSVFTNEGVTGMAAGFDHSCAIAAGSVYCWGRNNNGQLADGTTDDNPVAVEVGDNPDSEFSNTGVSQVVAGDASTCAIANGIAFCWGYDDYGKLGSDSEGDSTLPVRVMDNPSEGFVNDSIAWITAGEDHHCAIRAAAAFCWGLNADGQLGWDAGYDADLPGLVVSGGGFANQQVTDIDAGFWHTCAIADGLAYCWGDNGDGQLGDGTQVDSSLATAVCCAAGELEQFDLRVIVAGEGSVTSNVGGIDCADDCTTAFDDGSTVHLAAHADEGYVFTGWSGNCSGFGSCSVTMSQNLTAQANFAEAVDLEIDIPYGGGSVDGAGARCSESCLIKVGLDTIVHLTATPKPGYVFTGWQGACSGTGECVVSLATAGSVTARFELATLPATGGGSDLARVAVLMFGFGYCLIVAARRLRAAG